MNNTINELNNRHSIRKFIDKEISDSDKKLILEATFNAPSAGNMQLYSIIDIEDKQLKNELAISCDNQMFINEAKWVLLFCADYQKWFNAFCYENLNPRTISYGDLLLSMEDAIIAAQNSVTAAYSLGIDSCYIGDIMENGERVIDLLQLPKHVYPACMVVFGYKDEKHQGTKPKRVDSKYVVFKNQYKILTKEESEDMLKGKATSISYHDYMQTFASRKHNSDFSKEMQRSAKMYIDRFVEKD